MMVVEFCLSDFFVLFIALDCLLPDFYSYILDMFKLCYCSCYNHSHSAMLYIYYCFLECLHRYDINFMLTRVLLYKINKY